MKPVDSHCHLDFDQFNQDREKIIEKAKKNLEFVVNAGSNLKHNRSVLNLAERYPDVIIPNLGLHPTYLESFDEIGKIKDQIRENDPAAIGEIGLDHHHIQEEELRNKQKKVFKQMLELSEELDKPVVVHSRDAEKQAISIINKFSPENVMLHCFNGNIDLARKAVEKGFFIGITTQVLYSSHVQKLAEKVPLENMLLETDSPFLYRGERNEPSNVLESVEKISEIKQVKTEKVVRQTTSNVKNLFRKDIQ